MTKEDTMNQPFIDQETQAWLAQRVARQHLALRLGIEQEAEARIFGQGRNFFHPENWYSIHRLLHGALRLTGLSGIGRRNARRIQVVRNTVVLPHLPSAFDGYTLLQLTDLHLDMAEDIPHVIGEVVRDLEYDLCVLTGDYRVRTYGPYQAAVSAMQRLRVHLASPVYGELGNHDTVRMTPYLEKLDLRLLLNEQVVVQRGEDTLYLSGIDDPHYFRADNLEKAAQGIPSGAVAILLSHSPEIYRQAAHSGFDLMLSGHTHGGQICLPGGIPLTCNARCPRSLCAGAWRYGTLQGYTSRGAGVSILDARFNCPPEVTLHTLRRSIA